MSTPTCAYTADVLRSLYDATSHLHHPIRKVLFTLGLWRPSYIIFAIPPRAPEDAVHSDHPNRGYSLFFLLVQTTTQARAFSVVGPSVWNGLRLSQRLLPRILSYRFYSSLKTVLFSRARVGSASE